MKAAWARSRKGWAALLILLATGAMGERLTEPAWGWLRERTPELRVGDLKAALGQGLLLGVLGGFRNFLADVAWLRMTFFWAERSWPETEAGVRLAIALDPGTPYFWVQGARVLAYDVPVWRVQAAGRRGEEVSPSLERTLRNGQGWAALALLEEAFAYHPEAAWVWIEMAQIHLHVLEDQVEAARCFGEAADKPGAPFFAGRLHAELLRRMGRKREALEFYERWLPTLPPDDPAALTGLLRGRMEALQKEISGEAAVNPGPGPAP